MPTTSSNNPYVRSKKVEILQRRLEVARLTAMRLTQWEIAEKLNISQSTVSRDLKKIQQEWKRQYAEDLNTKKMREAAELEEMERECAILFLKEKDPRYMTARISIKTRKHKLLGLDAPSQISGPDGGPIPVITDLADVAARGFELLKLHPAIAEILKAQAKSRASKEADESEDDEEDEGEGDDGSR